MPLILPAGASAQRKRAGGFALAGLLEVQTRDGSNFFWATRAGSFVSKLTGIAQVFSPWLKLAGPIKLTRDLRSDAGDLTLQNLSGNTIDRDVAALLKAHEFEGALGIFRLWDVLLEVAVLEQHGKLTEQSPATEEATFRLLQLFDAAAYTVPAFDYQEQCPWRFKSALCGSAGAATVCNKLFATCKDATHAAQERFGGVPGLVQIPTTAAAAIVVGGPGTGGGGGGGPYDPGHREFEIF